MRLYRVGIIAIVAVLSVVRPANASDAADLYGKWIERFPDGKGMVTEFTPSTIVAYPVDSGGKPTQSATPAPVTYRDLGDDTIAIEFKGGGGIMARRSGANRISLIFPGMGARQLSKLE